MNLYNSKSTITFKIKLNVISNIRNFYFRFSQIQTSNASNFNTHIIFKYYFIAFFIISCYDVNILLLCI